MYGSAQTKNGNFKTEVVGNVLDVEQKRGFKFIILFKIKPPISI